MPSAQQERERAQIQAKLKELAEEISSDLSRLESAQGKELLSDFVSELFLSMAKQDQQAVRRQKQAEGIAAAKERGVRFGRPVLELPEDFEIWFARWRGGEITGKQMAEHCSMEISVLYRKLREAGISLN